MKHPTLMSSQERLSLANALDKMAQNPADYFDPDKLRVAANLIFSQEAVLTTVKAALGY